MQQATLAVRSDGFGEPFKPHVFQMFGMAEPGCSLCGREPTDSIHIAAPRREERAPAIPAAPREPLPSACMLAPSSWCGAYSCLERGCQVKVSPPPSPRCFRVNRTWEFYLPAGVGIIRAFRHRTGPLSDYTMNVPHVEHGERRAKPRARGGSNAV